MTTDDAGNVYVTGESAGVYPAEDDMLTIKYRHQYFVASEALLEPETQPLEIPAQGGSFSYQASLRNNTAQNETVDVGIFAVLPNSVFYGPIAYLSGVTIPAGQTLSFPGRSQAIPGGAPGGEYAFELLIGSGSQVVDASTFHFVKL